MHCCIYLGPWFDSQVNSKRSLVQSIETSHLLKTHFCPRRSISASSPSHVSLSITGRNYSKKKKEERKGKEKTDLQKTFRKKKNSNFIFFYSSMSEFLQLDLVFPFPHFLSWSHLPFLWYLLPRPGHMIRRLSRGLCYLKWPRGPLWGYPRQKS